MRPVRWSLFWLLWAALFLPAAAQTNTVQEFSGSGATTTGLFKVADRWEVRWNARQVISVAVMSSDGAIVAGAAGVLRGSLFVPLGGQYYLKISDGTTPTPAVVNPVPAKTNSAPASTNSAPANTNSAPANTNSAPASTNAAPTGTNSAPTTTNAPPAAPPPAANPDSPAPSPEPIVAWHLQVVELGKSVASDQALSVYTPYFMIPDAAVTPAAPPPVLPPPVLTEAQLQAMVSIKGDNAQGAGFLMRSPDGLFVVTHLHLLAANPNVTILTNSGAPITTLSLKVATDRDLALIAVKDDHFSSLPLLPDSAVGVANDDQLIIPNIGQQTDVQQGVAGKVIATGPERIDFDNALRTGSSGAPVIHVKTGNVLALVTAVKSIDVSDTLAQAWPANPPPGSAAIIPYYGLRLTGIQGWEKYDWPRFLNESLFLHQFHETTRALDSYLNGRRYHRRVFGEGNGPADSHYFLTNSKLRLASDSYKQLANGADENQRLDAARELLFDLESVADSDVSTLSGMTNLYAYDQAWAQEELAYRKALKKELDDLSSNIPRLDIIARSH